MADGPERRAHPRVLQSGTAGGWAWHGEWPRTARPPTRSNARAAETGRWHGRPLQGWTRVPAANQLDRPCVIFSEAKLISWLNLGGPTAPGLAESVFFSAPVPSGWTLTERYRFQFDAHDLFPLEVFKHPVEHPILRPAVHPCVNGMPVAEAGRQPSPLAARASLEHNQLALRYCVSSSKG